jgi:hypothetical protein
VIGSSSRVPMSSVRPWPWTATVHDLLVHVRAHAGPVVPEPVAVADGVEIVSFLPGDADPACWPWQATDAGLRSAAVLLRRIHEATRSWHPPAGARWSRPAAAGADVVCHGDPGPWNIVWTGGMATGLFDWDLAYPGPALDDVAYALEYLVPFRSDEVAVRWHGFTEPPDRPRPMALFAQAYGLPATAGLSTRCWTGSGPPSSTSHSSPPTGSSRSAPGWRKASRPNWSPGWPGAPRTARSC